MNRCGCENKSKDYHDRTCLKGKGFLIGVFCSAITVQYRKQRVDQASSTNCNNCCLQYKFAFLPSFRQGISSWTRAPHQDCIKFPYHNLVPPFPLHLSRPNSSTNDCIGLTGGYIPSWVKGAFLFLVASRPTIAKRIFTKLDPPADFLSMPLGAALRPSIDVISCRNSTPPIVHQPTSYKPSPLVPQQAPSSAATQPRPRPSTHPRTRHRSAACWARTAPSWPCSRPRRARRAG